MNLSGVSALASNQSVSGRPESQAAQDGNGSSEGWKYVTVQEGDIIYTYIVIGKNMKVLIGQTSVNKDKNKKTDDDKKDAAGGDTGTAGTGNSDKSTELVQNEARKIEAEKVNFLNDSRMLGLTGYYQKKLRETIRNLEDDIVYDKPDELTLIGKSEKNQMNPEAN